jgi:hypothetical protein
MVKKRKVLLIKIRGKEYWQLRDSKGHIISTKPKKAFKSKESAQRASWKRKPKPKPSYKEVSLKQPFMWFQAGIIVIEFDSSNHYKDLVFSLRTHQARRQPTSLFSIQSTVNLINANWDKWVDVNVYVLSNMSELIAMLQRPRFPGQFQTMTNEPMKSTFSYSGWSAIYGSSEFSEVDGGQVPVRNKWQYKIQFVLHSFGQISRRIHTPKMLERERKKRAEEYFR